MTIIILQTKLFIPPVRADFLQRPRLMNKLNQGRNEKMTLISAPAGFGKSVLASEWIREEGVKAAWLSLDENDNDIVRFLTYLCASLQTVGKNLGKTAASLLETYQPAELEPILSSLINDIVQLDQSLLLVLDDYHLIHDKTIHHAIDFFLGHIPPQIHLVIVTRVNPPLALAKLRGRRQLNEIRVKDLRFTHDEIASFLNKQLELNLTKDDISKLAERTEGWVTGLQLTALSLQDQQEPTDFIEAFTGSDQYILDYLLEEVLEQQSAEVQQFLMQTAILHRLSASLCNEVIRGKNSQEILEHLQRTNLFIIPLDNEKTWFRFHHLFANFLVHWQQQTDPTQTIGLHERASGWYEKNGFITEAIHHAQATADYDRAAHLILENSQQVVYKGYYNTVFGWVNSMPTEQIDLHPNLAIIKAWQMWYLMQLSEIDPYINIAQNALEKKDYGNAAQDMHGEIFTLKAWAALYMGSSQRAIEYSYQALDYLSSDNIFTRSLVLSPLAGALMNEGRTKEAIITSQEAITAYEETENMLSLMGSAFELSEIFTISGQLNQAESLLQSILNNYRSDMPVAGIIFAGLGIVAYEKNELEKASSYLKTSLDLSHRALSRLYALFALAQTVAAVGEKSRSLSILEEIESIIHQWMPRLIATYLPAIKIHTALLSHDVDLASRWQKEHQFSWTPDRAYTNEFQSVTFARLLMMQGNSEADNVKLEEAGHMLFHIEKSAAAAGRLARVMETQILQAIVYDLTGKETLAISTLTTALELAEAEGYKRMIINHGPLLARLLHKLPESLFISEMLESLTPILADNLEQEGLVEPLSDRELDVLRLAARDFAYREIAAELVVSLNTVRYHMKNIYTKLGVNKKGQAITRAQELNLL